MRQKKGSKTKEKEGNEKGSAESKQDVEWECKREKCVCQEEVRDV